MLAALLSASGPSLPWSLMVGGTEMIKPNSAGNGTAAPIEAIQVTEAGPGGVSSMTFDVEDPGRNWQPSKRLEVIFADIANSHREFHGWISGYGSEIMGGVGRVWHIRCDGPEKILDWLFVPSLVIPSGTRVRDAIQMIFGSSIGVAVPYTTRATPFQGGFVGDIGQEIAAWGNVPTQITTTQALTITAQSVRQAVDQVMAVCAPVGDPFFYDPTLGNTGFLTVDMDLAVRSWLLKDGSGTSWMPADWTVLTVTDTVAGALRAHDLEHDQDYGDDPSSVYVTGGNAAGTLNVARGDGLPGPVIPAGDSTVLTALSASAVGNSVLVQKSSAAAARGSFGLQDQANPGTAVHPGSFLVLTDTEQAASGTYRIAEISKTYTSLRENWRVAYGGLAPSLPRAIRRLTRTLST